MCTCLQIGATPLHFAACHGHNESIKKLVDAGATVDAVANVS